MNTIDFQNRIQKKLKHLKKWASRNNIHAWRLYDKDIPQFPFAIDLYNNHCHFQIFEKNNDLTHEDNKTFINNCITITSKITQIPQSNFHLKIRQQQKGTSQYQKNKTNTPNFLLEENNRKFYINLDKYLDTGLFLDHRNLRQIVAENAENKSLLNLYAYTASFSVYAATANASHSLSVDLSKTYTQWAKRNFELNNINLNDHTLINDDVSKILKQLIASNKNFDLIVLDPPSFSNSKKLDHFLDIQRDHTTLIEQAYKCLNQNGKLYFSTNLKSFKPNPQLFQTYNIKEITHKTTPEDFKNSKPHRVWIIEKPLLC